MPGLVRVGRGTVQRNLLESVGVVVHDELGSLDHDVQEGVSLVPPECVYLHVVRLELPGESQADRVVALEGGCEGQGRVDALAWLKRDARDHVKDVVGAPGVDVAADLEREAGAVPRTAQEEAQALDPTRQPGVVAQGDRLLHGLA
jgi:hypothetical protein